MKGDKHVFYCVEEFTALFKNLTLQYIKVKNVKSINKSIIAKFNFIAA